MHFYHTYLVKANDREEAKQEVEEILEQYSELYDYYNFFTVSDKIDQKIYKYCLNNSYSKGDELIVPLNKETDSFLREIIKQKMNSTKETLEEYKKDLIKTMKKEKIVSFSQLSVPNHDEASGMFGYYLKKIGELIQGYLNNETFFFDFIVHASLIDDTQLDKYLQDDVYAVFVDLHN